MLCGWMLLGLLACSSDRTDEATALNLTTSGSSLDIEFPDRFITLTATVTDSDSDVLSNASVQFSTSLGSFSATTAQSSVTVRTNNGGNRGIATAKLYPGAVSGTATITAYINGVQQTLNVTINGPAQVGVVSQLEISRSTDTVNTAFPEQFTKISVVATDAGGRVVPNQRIEFAATLGSFASSTHLPTATATTDSSGQAMVLFYPHTTPGIAEISAYIGGVRTSIAVTIENSTSSDTTDSLSLSASTLELDTAFPARFSELRVEVRDSKQNLLSNQTIELSTTLGSFSETNEQHQIQLTSGTGSSLGIALAKLYPGNTPGSAVVTAYSNGRIETKTLTIAGVVITPSTPAPSK